MERLPYAKSTLSILTTLAQASSVGGEEFGSKGPALLLVRGGRHGNNSVRTRNYSRRTFALSRGHKDAQGKTLQQNNLLLIGPLAIGSNLADTLDGILLT